MRKFAAESQSAVFFNSKPTASAPHSAMRSRRISYTHTMNNFNDSLFLQKMREVAPISAETAALLGQHLTPCSFEKREMILEKGKKCRYVWLLEQGMVRHYWMNEGSEIVTSFSIEGHLIFSMDELYYDEKSQEYAQATEPVKAYRIPVHTMRELFATNLEICNWGRIIHQNEYRRLHRTHRERLTLPAAERYEMFLKDFPVVSLRANLYDIASYLGITPSTLSKLRAKV